MESFCLSWKGIWFMGSNYLILPTERLQASRESCSGVRGKLCLLAFPGPDCGQGMEDGDREGLCRCQGYAGVISL